MESMSFADYFGMEIPTEKKVEKKKTAPKKETESKSSNGKKKEEKKYSLPVTVHSEIGDVVVEGLEDLTLKEIAAKLGFGNNVEVIENGGDFICIFTPTSMKDVDEIEGIVKFGREEYEETMSVKELKEILLEDHPELGSISNFDIAKLGNKLYIVRLKNPVEMSLQLTENAKIGFMGKYSKVEEAMTLKEAVSKWESKESWLSKVDKNYYFDENTEIVMICFAKMKSTSTELLVKVPCNISFIHDSGPLSEGLTYEMFGKEYVNADDILSLVSKYFDGYKKDNSTVSYIPQNNTVCVMLAGRKKGIKDVYTGEIINGSYVHTAPKIPFTLLEETRRYFIEECPKEALVQIIYNKGTRTYRLYIPDVEADKVSLKWSDMDILKNRGIDEIVVCEIHSHNSMPAFFSGVDDSDEILPMIYGVMGKLGTRDCEVKFRVRSGKDFYKIRIHELFEEEVL